jgi:general secretion pathway protein D
MLKRLVIQLSLLFYTLQAGVVLAQTEDKATTTTKGYKPPARPGAPTSPVSGKPEAKPAEPAYSAPQGDADFDCKDVKSSTKVQPNFENVEIREVVEWVSTTTCKRFIISDKVKGGKITIMSPVPVTATEAYRAFEVALASNGLAIVNEGKFLKIVEDKEKGAAFSISAVGDLPSGDNVVTQLYPIQHGDANEMSKVLEKFKTDAGDITVYNATNLMIITDRGSAIRRMVRILEQIDRPGLGEQIYVLEARYAKASELASMITDVFQPKGGPAASAAATAKPKVRPTTTGKPGEAVPEPSSAAESGSATSADANVSKVISDERTNQLVIVASKASYEKVLYLLEKLDVEVPGSDGIHVLRLQNANATDLAAVLSSLSKGGASSKSGGGRNPRTPAAPSAPPQAGGTTGGEAGELFSGEVKINADESTNALVVVASKNDFEVVERVVKMLDIPRRQVFLEAMIFEVSLQKDRNIGVSFHGGLPLGDPPSGLVFGGHQQAGLSSLVPTLLPGLTLGAIGGEPINIGGVNIPPIGVILNAIANDSEANILSTPTLLATDNEEAEITVGQNIPVPTNAGIGGLLGQAGAAAGAAGGNLGALAGLAGGFGALTPQITRQDIGVTLRVTPQINEGDYVTLQLQQEITAIQSIDANGPTLSNRRANSVVTVKDQQTIVIGGLIEDRITTTVKKLPVLGDIPLIGYLFRNQNKIKTKTNLVIVITPHIIKDSSDFRVILEKKLEDRRQFIEQFTNGEDSLLSFDYDYRRKRGTIDALEEAFAQAEREEAEKAEAANPKDIIIEPKKKAPTSVPVEEKPEEKKEEKKDGIDLNNPSGAK